MSVRRECPPTASLGEGITWPYPRPSLWACQRTPLLRVSPHATLHTPQVGVSAAEQQG